MIEKNELDCVPVSLAKIIPDEPLSVDMYIHISQRYILYRNQGDVLDSKKYNKFLSKSINTVYICKVDLEKFMSSQKESKEKIVNEFVKEVGEDNREIVEKREEIKEKVFETFASEELSSETVNILQETVTEFIGEVQEKGVAPQLLAKMTKASDSLAEHAVNTAQLSIFLAMALGHGHSLILENIYMGALLHDYAKAKIPPKVLEQPTSNLYEMAIKEHPIKGAKALKKIEGISEQVITIVLQHHEQYNGLGYPKGIKGNDIYELAKIVSIANQYDNVRMENKNRAEKEQHKMAIKSLEVDTGKVLDPELTPRVLDALKLAYGGYYRERKS